MKLIIEEKNGEHLVLSDDNKICFGCHANEGLAKEQLDSMESHNNEQLFRLPNIHIFNTGTWNGQKYSIADLDKIVESFNEMGFRPPVKIGHGDDDSAPAFGWIESIKRVGDGLFADFMDLPETVFTAIKDHRYDAVSSEIFFNLKRGGKTFARALKAVALLGSAIPGVNLRPLRESFTITNAGQLATYTLKTEDLDMPKKNDKTINKDDFTFTDLAGAKTVVDNLIAKFETLSTANSDGNLDGDIKKLTDQLKTSNQQIAALTETNRQKDIEAKVNALRVPAYRAFIKQFYELATLASASEKTVMFKEGDKENEISIVAFVDKLVAKLNKDTDILFKEITVQSDLSQENFDDDKDPGTEVDRMVKEYMADKDTDDYQAAMNHVLGKNPELKKAYLEQKAD
jgi:hypothetical protein